MNALHHSVNAASTSFGNCPLLYLGVPNDDRLIRITALKAALWRIAPHERARHLVNAAGSSISYWSGLLAGHRSFGAAVARRLEDALKLPRYYLDGGGGVWSPDTLEIARHFEALPTATEWQLNIRVRLYKSIIGMLVAPDVGDSNAREQQPAQQPTSSPLPLK